MKIEIIKMDMCHIDHIMEVENSSFSIPWSKQAFIDEMNNNLSYYVVAEVGGKPIGYGGLWIILDEGHITNIAVHPDHRKNGVANAILQNIMDFAKKNRLVFLTLEVRESNVAAISLYDKFGFRRVGIRKGYYYDNNEDAVLMTIFL